LHFERHTASSVASAIARIPGTALDRARRVRPMGSGLILLRRVYLFNENLFASSHFDRKPAKVKDIVVHETQVFRQIKTANRTREGFTTFDLFEVVVSRNESRSERTKLL